MIVEALYAGAIVLPGIVCGCLAGRLLKRRAADHPSYGVGLTEEKLIGWLCITRYTMKTQGIGIPARVVEQLKARGWVDPIDDEVGRLWGVKINAAGLRVSDLHAEEWGIEHDFGEDDDDET